MRALFSWRLVAALGALVLLAVIVDRTAAAPTPEGSIALTAPVDIGPDGEPMRRRVDLIAPIETIERSDDFALGPDGLTVGFFDAVLDEERVMRIAPGTPGQVTCRNLVVPRRCVVLADVLGQAVVWFAVVPAGPRDTIELGPIVDLEDGFAVFENGWEIPFPPVIERDDGDGGTCAGTDIVNFSDFLRRFGPDSTTIVDIETGLVTEVECGEEFVAPTTTVLVEGTPRGEIVSATTSVPAAGIDDVIRPDEG